MKRRIMILISIAKTVCKTSLAIIFIATIFCSVSLLSIFNTVFCIYFATLLYFIAGIFLMFKNERVD